ncbi:hypothetical protein [Pradoshia sp.]
MKKIIKKMTNDAQKAMLTSSYNRVKPPSPNKKAIPIEKPSDTEK